MIYRNEGTEEQYEGGRSANRREEREYVETDDGNRRDDQGELQSAKLATKLVQNELRRRGAVGAKIRSKDEMFSSSFVSLTLDDGK